ncbi:2'-5' RNA ligase family protein [Nocardia sp. NPDC050712]|uniref:2'-5' RNA ligase family protein n=1 Tax=Nocardia sp. NPDC050712 TaxID=3155518 RepID=UPI0033EA6FEB
MIRSNDWSAFQALTTIEDHWAPGSPEPDGYYWQLKMSDPPLVDLASRCQRDLANDVLDPAPLAGLHLPVLHVGRADEVSDEQVTAIAEAGRRAAAAVRPFRLSVGPLTGSRSALRLSVTPWDPLLDLHQRLRAATAPHQPAEPAETADFRPHLGVGYFNRQLDPQGLLAAVGPLRALPPVTVRVQQIQLVELRRVGREYQWRDRAVVPLG